MKKLLQFILLIAALSFFATACVRSIEFDPKTGLYLQFDIQYQNINANATKAGETFKKDTMLNIGKIFNERYNIDVSKLDSFYVESLEVSFSQDNCKKLKSYALTTTFPVAGTLTLRDRCDFTLIGGKPSMIKLGKLQSDVYSKALVKTNLADYIKTGGAIPFTFTMVAQDDIPSGFGVEITMTSRAYYKP